MARFWDERAREQPQHFILSGEISYENPDEDAFFASGERDVRNFLKEAGYQPTGRDRLLEIGCGAGRMTRAFAARFGSVHAVDISSEMVHLAQRNLAGYKNVAVSVSSGTDLHEFVDASFDFCFSYIVFQHIPDPAVTVHYIQEMARVLVPAGHAYFQLNTRRFSVIQALRNQLMLRTRLDRLLKRRTARTRYDSAAWRGSTLSEPAVRAAISSAQLRLVSLDGVGLQVTWVHALKDAMAGGGMVPPGGIEPPLQP